MVIVGEKVKKNIKEFVGVVVSDKMDKTRVVLVERTQMHPLYKKPYTKRKKYYVHDENNESKVGDVVRIRETRPLSKLKRWRLIEIVEKAK
jgi:small subunit ribosomal protein S17